MKINSKDLCEFEIKFQCKKHWDDLDKTFPASPPESLRNLEVRYCHSCCNNVYFAKSKDELDLIASSDNCAAFAGDLDIYFNNKFPRQQSESYFFRPTLGVIAKPQEEYAEEIETRKVQLKNLINLGKDRGFLTHDEINEQLPENLIDSEAIEGIIQIFGEMGIEVREK
jgi:hypothetical protein